ncbi:MAG: hypothetical protein AAGB25_07910 [Pseudomonadota bacterium]
MAAKHDQFWDKVTWNCAKQPIRDEKTYEKKLEDPDAAIAKVFTILKASFVIDRD